jgi:hypothetical protein
MNIKVRPGKYYIDDLGNQKIGISATTNKKIASFA